MMPLAMANNGEEQLIKKVGGKEETRLFLEKIRICAGIQSQRRFGGRWQCDHQC